MSLLIFNNIIPLFIAASSLLHGKMRKYITIICSVLLITNNVVIYCGNHSELLLVNFLGNYQISLSSDYISSTFALMVSSLYLITNLYSFGYLKISNLAHDFKPKINFFFMPIAIMATLNLGYSKNLMSLFIFYEILTLSTYPLVVQSFSEHAQKAGKFYLWTLFGSSSVFLIIALLYVDKYFGSLSFRMGGTFDQALPVKDFIILLICFVFGFSKTGIFPFYAWLPKAMVAPVPVSSLLHAVAVVKAGIFALLKIFVYFFGLGYLQKIHLTLPWAIDWLSYLACFTIIFASIMACLQKSLKKILAYSTISQLSYMILSLSIATDASINATLIYMLAHSVAKITLFFAAGIIYLSLHKVDLQDMKGIARLIPFPVIIFAVAAISIIGLPISVGFLASSRLYSVIACKNLVGAISITTLLISKLLACFYFGRIIFVMTSPATELPYCFNKNSYLNLVTLISFILASTILAVWILLKF